MGSQTRTTNDRLKRAIQDKLGDEGDTPPKVRESDRLKRQAGRAGGRSQNIRQSRDRKGNKTNDKRDKE